MTEIKKLMYQSRLLYENVLSEALKTCLRERVNDPNGKYLRSVKAFSLAMPRRIKKEYKKWLEKNNDKTYDTLLEEYDEKIEFLLGEMEKNQLLIPERTLPRGGGYR